MGFASNLSVPVRVTRSLTGLRSQSERILWTTRYFSIRDVLNITQRQSHSRGVDRPYPSLAFQMLVPASLERYQLGRNPLLHRGSSRSRDPYLLQLSLWTDRYV